MVVLQTHDSQSPTNSCNPDFKQDDQQDNGEGKNNCNNPGYPTLTATNNSVFMAMHMKTSAKTTKGGVVITLEE